MELNKIYNEECIQGMRNRAEDQSIDLILCDLPYSQTSASWDSLIDFNELWTEYKRIIKPNGIIALTAKGGFMIDLILSNREWYRYDWVVDKDKGANFAHVRYRPLNIHEHVLIFYNKTGTYNPQMVQGKPYKQKRLQESIKGIADNLGRYTTESDGMRYPKSIIRAEGMAQRHIIHPTMKSLDLFRYIIRTYTNEGDLVLDNCMGSGTTAVACVHTGRNYIGFEMDTEQGYYKDSLYRVQGAVEGRDDMEVCKEIKKMKKEKENK